jgi:hypothetical protein
MFARHTLSHRFTAVLAALLIAVAVLPGAASARPAIDAPGGTSELVAEPSTPAPTVVRTVVKDDAVAVLPIALAGAALLIAIAGTGYAMVRIAPMRQQLRGLH